MHEGIKKLKYQGGDNEKADILTLGKDIWKSESGKRKIFLKLYINDSLYLCHSWATVERARKCSEKLTWLNHKLSSHSKQEGSIHIVKIRPSSKEGSYKH